MQNMKRGDVDLWFENQELWSPKPRIFLEKPSLSNLAYIYELVRFYYLGFDVLCCDFLHRYLIDLSPDCLVSK